MLSRLSGWWKLFVVTFVVLVALFWLLREGLLWVSAEQERAFLRGSVARELDATAALLDEQSHFVEQMVRIMARDADLLGWLESPQPSQRNALEQRWQALAEHFKVFNQVRFLSPVGQELIRVDYDHLQERAVPVSQLQYKGGRPYFLHAMGLADGEVMFSRIDLNMEHGQITVPYVPTIRVITPITVDNTRQGYLVVNLSLQVFTAILSQIETSLGEEPWIVNNDGYFIQAQVAEMEWGMLIPERMHHNLHDISPHFWLQLKRQHTGELPLSERQTVLFKRVQMGQSPDGPHWVYLITPLNEALIEERISPMISVLNWVMLFWLISSGFVATQLATYWTNRKQQQQALLLAQAALDSMSGVVITDARGKIHTINKTFTEVTGYEAADAIGNYPSFLHAGEQTAADPRQIWRQLNRDGHWKGEIWTRRRNGESYPQLTSIKAIYDARGNIEHFVGNFTDLTAQKNLEAQLRAQAETDPLTGLNNRRRFEQILTHELALAKRYGQPFCLALMDADHFKRINDCFGHDVGDAVLKFLAETGRETLRQTDSMGRWGGEEFILLLHRTEIDGAELVVERLRTAIEANDIHPGLSCSFGLAQWRPGDDSVGLLKRVDEALYCAKSAGRNRVMRAA